MKEAAPPVRDRTEANSTEMFFAPSFPISSAIRMPIEGKNKRTDRVVVSGGDPGFRPSVFGWPNP
eukprot:12936335-Prorocentrum_lima.AAC.1